MTRSGQERRANRRSRRQKHGTYDHETSGFTPEESKSLASIERLAPQTAENAELIRKAVSWNKEDGKRWLTDATVEHLMAMLDDPKRLTPRHLVIINAMRPLLDAVKKTGSDSQPLTQKQQTYVEKMARLLVQCEAQNQRDDLGDGEVAGDNHLHIHGTTAADILKRISQIPDDPQVPDVVALAKKIEGP